MSTEILQPPKLGISRMLLLGASSVVLCLSYLMAMFTPFPLAMATVLYGRARGYLMVLLGFTVCLALGRVGLMDYSLAGSYAVLSLFAVSIAETALNLWRPVRSLVVTGALFIMLVLGSFAAYVKVEKKTVHTFVTEQVGLVLQQLENAKKLGAMSQDLADLGLARPAGEIATELIKAAPGYLIMGTFFVLWVNAYLVLKGRRLLHPAHAYEHDERTLLNFKVPFIAAYGVAAALALAVWGAQVDPQWGTAAGMLCLQTLGVFYFFQGFGVTLNFLNHYNVVGFFRTISVMALVFFLPWAVAVLGLFDTWFDFNNKIQKKVSN